MRTRDQRWLLGLCIGTGLGAAFGVVLMKVADHRGFYAVGIALGMALGTAVGLMLDRR